uniref:Uncharacterized protein n=1 Tax=Arundo donax TaxID=35708 RepID=A0A0A9B2F1_ARUDO
MPNISNPACIFYVGRQHRTYPGRVIHVSWKPCITESTQD